MTAERDRLEAECDELFDAIDRLDEEHATGDLDAVDHQTLRDDLTERAAAVLRALDGDAVVEERIERRVDARPAGSEGPSVRRRRVLWAVGVAVFILVAGLGIAEASRQRGSMDLLSGDIRQTTRDQLLVAREQWATGDVDAALATYAMVLAVVPTDPEALTYSAWVGRTLAGTVSDEDALAQLEEALASDPDFADARVFRALILRDLGRYDEALDELERLGEGDVPVFMADQVAGVIAELRLETGTFTGGDERAGDAFARYRSGDVVGALEVLDLWLAEDPDAAEALAARGLVLAQVAAQSAGPERVELEAAALSGLDRAVDLAPEDPVPWLYRAAANAVLDRREAAAADLRRLDDLDVPASLRGDVEAVSGLIG